MPENSERRSRQRQRVLKAGKIVFKGGNSVVDCQVRSLSESGARLRLAITVGIPDEFELRIGDEASRKCRMAWRDAQDIGVAFI